MTSFIGVIACAYFYLLCLKIEDWKWVFRTLYCILFVEVFLLIMQITHRDTLLNFGRPDVIGCFGSIGNPMQLKGLIIILTVLIIQNFKKLEKYLTVIYSLIIFLGLVYWVDHKCWDNFLYARGSVWMDTIKMSFHATWKRCLIGNGLGTFKALFPVYGKGRYVLEGTWMNTHNTYIQFLFEAGFIGFGLLIGYTISLLKKCKGLLLLGAILVAYTLMFQYPDREAAIVPLLILFISFIERKKNVSDKVTFSE
jgi:O-antigen ligase